MNALLEQFQALFGVEETRSALRAATVFVLGMTLAIFLPRRFRRFNLHPQQKLIFRVATRYTLVIITSVWTLHELGLNLSVLFGAAGILTVALGFASQASASNLISGLFMMFESHFVVGDIITVGEITGEVVSIDPLSVKVRTFQNLSVRIPNETMLKSNVTNLSGYPVRRYDMKLTIGYDEDLARVSTILMNVAADIEICLDEPTPLVIFQGWEERGLALQFSVWATRPNYLELMNRTHVAVREAFRENDVVIPVLRRELTMVTPAEHP